MLFACILLYIKRKNQIKQIEKKNKPTQLELYRQFGEEVLLDCGIPLENFFVKPHYESTSGICFTRNKFDPNKYPLLSKDAAYKHYFNDEKYTTKDLTQPYNYSNKFNKDEVYIIVPEIVDQYTLYVWLHEIGHYIQHHYEGYEQKPSFVKEYEAENYARTLMRLCPVEETERFYSKNFAQNMFDINLQYAINSGKDYVKSHFEKAKFCEKVLNMTPQIKEYLDNKVVLYNSEA